MVRSSETPHITPIQRYVIGDHDYFAFSDIRRLIAQKALDDNFSIDLFNDFNLNPPVHHSSPRGAVAFNGRFASQAFNFNLM